MKRIVVIATALVCALALFGCGSQASSSSASASGSSAMSASDKSASAASQSASASSAAINWTSAKTAEEAAKGAGFTQFGVPSRTVIANYTFANPEFAYSENVAQATYTIDGYVRLTIRKAESAPKVPLTTQDASEFSQSWKGTYEGLEVTCYGNAKDEASIFLWNDGSKQYGASIESLGTNKVTMDSTDVDDIVKAVKSAETIQTTQKTNTATELKPGFDVEKAVFNNGLGQLVSYYAVQGADGKIYWGIITKGSDGKEYTTYLDSNGALTTQELEVGDLPDADSDLNANSVAFTYGLGEVVSYYYVQGEGGAGYWAIVTKGSDGVEYTTYVDSYGNMVQGASVEVGDLADADASFDPYANTSTDATSGTNSTGGTQQ